MAKISKMQRKEEIAAWLFITPNLLGFLIFFLIPILFAFVLSFCRWDLLNPIQFRGLHNYISLFRDNLFYKSMLNTIIYCIISVPVCLAVALVMAIGLNKKLYGKVIYRTIYFMPYITTSTAVAAVWIWIYHPKGLINNLLMFLGFEDLPMWLADPQYIMSSLAIIGAWRGMGYAMLIYLAALQNIPDEMYEAATIDGAGAWQKFRYVTFPMLTPTTFFLVVTKTITALKSFDIIYAVTGGGPGTRSYVMVMYIYQTAFQSFKMGYASALAYILFFIVFFITYIQWKSQKSWVNE